MRSLQTSLDVLKTERDTLSATTKKQLLVVEESEAEIAQLTNKLERKENQLKKFKEESEVAISELKELLKEKTSMAEDFRQRHNTAVSGMEEKVSDPVRIRVHPLSGMGQAIESPSLMCSCFHHLHRTGGGP